MLIHIALMLFFLAPASVAQDASALSYPVDVAVDAKGQVFVADHELHALLRWSDEGFSVVAQGEGLPRTPLYGIRHIVPASDGRIIASDPATMKLYAIDASGSVTPLPDDDGFVTPWGVAVERSGSVLAVDRVLHRLRRVQSDGKTADVAEIRAPRAIVLEDGGTIVVLTDDALLRVSEEGTSPITESPPFEFPHDAVRHPDGSFYVTDGYAKTVWRVAPDGGVTAFIQGEPLMSPQGIAVDGDGNLLVADAHARAVFRITPKGELSELSR